MRGYVTPTRFASTFNLPILLPQTELRRGRYITCGQFQLSLGQTMRVRVLSLHLVSILTASATPSSFSSALGIVSAGIYLTPMMSSSPCLLVANAPGVTALNPFSYRDFSTPGIYYFIVSNNTSNVDVTVAVTGVAKLFNVA
jgi:hypothetical protein